MDLLTDSYGVALTIASLFLTLIWYLKSSSRWRYRLPPGPFGLPIVGILPYLDPKNPSVDVLRMSKRYGKVFGGFLGSYRAVFLNDYDTIKETFSRTDDVFNDRPRISAFELYSNGQGRFFDTFSGDCWSAVSIPHLSYSYHFQTLEKSYILP